MTIRQNRYTFYAEISNQRRVFQNSTLPRNYSVVLQKMVSPLITLFQRKIFNVSTLSRASSPPNLHTSLMKFQRTHRRRLSRVRKHARKTPQRSDATIRPRFPASPLLYPQPPRSANQALKAPLEVHWNDRNSSCEGSQREN